MTCSIVVITEDSRVKLPEINPWKSRLGRGIDIEHSGEIQKLLRANNLGIPSNDLELEEIYREVLKDYIRPARLMFAGMFSEVREFCEEIKRYGNVELYILSGRYGLIHENDEIIPYNFHLKDKKAIEELDKRTGFIDKLRKVTSMSDILIIIFPRYILEYLTEKESFSGGKLLRVTVCSNSIRNKMEELEFITFERSGVARIGKENRERIIHLIGDVVNEEVQTHERTA